MPHAFRVAQTVNPRCSLCGVSAIRSTIVPCRTPQLELPLSDVAGPFLDEAPSLRAVASPPSDIRRRTGDGGRIAV